MHDNQDGHGAKFARSKWSSVALQVLCALVGLGIWIAPIGQVQGRHTYAIVTFMVLAWALGAMQYWITGLLGCFLFWALQVAPLKIAFGGFATETPWFSLGALLLGAVGVKSGLAERFAYSLIRRLAPGYFPLLVCLAVTSFLLTLLVPSGVARVVIMSSIALGVIGILDLEPGSNIGRGLFLVLTYSSSIFDKMILAGSAAMIGRHLISSNGHVTISYTDWLVAFLPSSLLMIAILPLAARWLFPARVPEGKIAAIKQEGPTRRGWTLLEVKSLILFVGAFALWLTEGWHGISPAVVGLGAGLLATIPAMGLLTSDDAKRINIPSVFFVGATLSMAAVMTFTGATRDVAQMIGWGLLHLSSHPVASVAGLYWLGFAAHLFLASELSMLSASMPALMQFAVAHHLNVKAIGLVWTYAASGKVFVYQSTVLVVGASYGFFTGRDLLKFGLVLTVVQFLVLLGLAAFYWPLLHLT